MALRVIEDTAGSLKSVAMLVSVCAGVGIHSFASIVDVPIARIMPSILCAVGESATAYCTTTCSDEIKATLMRVLAAFGPAHEIPESLFDAYSALGGSGNLQADHRLTVKRHLFGRKLKASSLTLNKLNPSLLQKCFITRGSIYAMYAFALKVRHLFLPSSKRLPTGVCNGEH